MLGIMCKDERRNWSIYRSTREDDVPASDNIKVVHNRETNEKEFRHCCRLLDNVTCLPWGRIGLYGDVIKLRDMRRLLKSA